MNIVENIKNKLLEKKEEKKLLLKESEIIESRFAILIENLKVKNKKTYNKLLNLLMIESITLHNGGFNENLISENLENVLSTLDNLFKGSNKPAIEMFKEKGITWIVKELKITDTSMREFLLDYLMRTELVNVPKLFSNCEYLKEKISEGIPLYYEEKISFEQGSGYGNDFMGIVNGSLKSSIKESDLDKRISSRISPIVCPIVEKLNIKFEEYLRNMKKRLISQEKGTQM